MATNTPPWFGITWVADDGTHRTLSAGTAMPALMTTNLRSLCSLMNCHTLTLCGVVGDYATPANTTWSDTTQYNYDWIDQRMGVLGGPGAGPGGADGLGQMVTLMQAPTWMAGWSAGLGDPWATASPWGPAWTTVSEPTAANADAWASWGLYTIKRYLAMFPGQNLWVDTSREFTSNWSGVPSGLSTYITAYNKLWDLVKADPVARVAKIGGPCGVLTGRAPGYGNPGPTFSWGSLDATEWEVYTLWAAQAHGFDFVAADMNQAALSQPSSVGAGCYWYDVTALIASQIAANGTGGRVPIFVVKGLGNTDSGSGLFPYLLDNFSAAGGNVFLLWHQAPGNAGLLVDTTGATTDVFSTVQSYYAARPAPATLPQASTPPATISVDDTDLSLVLPDGPSSPPAAVANADGSFTVTIPALPPSAQSANVYLDRNKVASGLGAGPWQSAPVASGTHRITYSWTGGSSIVTPPPPPPSGTGVPATPTVPPSVYSGWSGGVAVLMADDFNQPVGQINSPYVSFGYSGMDFGVPGYCKAAEDPIDYGSGPNYTPQIYGRAQTTYDGQGNLVFTALYVPDSSLPNPYPGVSPQKHYVSGAINLKPISIQSGPGPSIGVAWYPDQLEVVIEYRVRIPGLVNGSRQDAYCWTGGNCANDWLTPVLEYDFDESQNGAQNQRITVHTSDNTGEYPGNNYDHYDWPNICQVGQWATISVHILTDGRYEIFKDGTRVAYTADASGNWKGCTVPHKLLSWQWQFGMMPAPAGNPVGPRSIYPGWTTDQALMDRVVIYCAKNAPAGSYIGGGIAPGTTVG